MGIKRFEDIEAWQLARALANRVYVASKSEPWSGDFALVDQIRRAAGSAMHNIAEGFDAGSTQEFVRFLRYAQRSASEVQSQLYLALDQGYIDQPEFDDLYEAAAKNRSKIGAFIAYLIRSRGS